MASSVVRSSLSFLSRTAGESLHQITVAPAARLVRNALLVSLTIAVAIPPPANGQQAGRIEGVVSIATSLVNPRVRVRVYDEPGATPVRPVVDKHPLDNVVLYLAANPALRSDTDPTLPPPALRQRNERFVPHVLPVVVGARVLFPNEDPIFHNVFSLSSPKSFDLGRYPRGDSRGVTFTKPGVVQVFCHIHADMSGYILVLDNRFFVTPDTLGDFALDGIPPGDYSLVAWHERIKPVRTPVHVSAGDTTALRIHLPLTQPAPPP